MQPLWVRVDANRTKLTAFVVLFVLGSAVLLSLALVAVPGALFGLVLATPESGYWVSYALTVAGAIVVLLVLGSLVAAIQLANAEDWVRNRFSGRALGPGEAPELESALTDMALAAGLSAPPSVLVLAEQGENAFASGNRTQAGGRRRHRGDASTVHAPMSCEQLLRRSSRASRPATSCSPQLSRR